MKHLFSTLLHRSFIMASLSATLVSCESVFDDDLPECRTENRIVFRYDYNMKYADAFPAEVNSVKIWAFDQQGNPVWSASESGEALRSKDFYIECPLQPGSYDFLTWCGLEGNDSFNLLTESPQNITQLGVDLLLKGGSRDGEFSGLYSDNKFSGLYHALEKGVEIYRNPTANETREIELSLMKDTKYVKVLLQNLDGKEMKTEDFSISISADDSELAYDNSVLPDTPEFRYLPWSLTGGVAEMPDGMEGTVTSVSSVLAELSTSRLMKGAECYLTVTRNSDGKEIIRIPFIEYLLLVKGNYRPMSDQEYLDRQDEYSLTFFLDSGLNWYSRIGIYINSWHVVPKQDTPLH